MKNLNIAIPIAERVKPSRNIGYWVNKTLAKCLDSQPHFPEMLELLNLKGSQTLDFESISTHLAFQPGMDYSRELKKLKLSAQTKLAQVKEYSMKIELIKPVITKLSNEKKRKEEQEAGCKKRKRRKKKDLKLDFQVSYPIPNPSSAPMVTAKRPTPTMRVSKYISGSSITVGKNQRGR